MVDKGFWKRRLFIWPYYPYLQKWEDSHLPRASLKILWDSNEKASENTLGSPRAPCLESLTWNTDVSGRTSFLYWLPRPGSACWWPPAGPGTSLSCSPSWDGRWGSAPHSQWLSQCPCPRDLVWSGFLGGKEKGNGKAASVLRMFECG